MPSDSAEEPSYDAQCIVCLKTVRDGDGICRFPVERRWLTICCPLCMAAFEVDPKAYLGRKLPPREDHPSMF